MKPALRRLCHGTSLPLRLLFAMLVLTAPLARAACTAPDSGHFASILQGTTASSATATITQSGAAAPASACIEQQGIDSTATITQISSSGQRNVAEVLQSGGLSGQGQTLTISQDGDNNLATGEQNGSSLSATLIQEGSGLTASLSQSGSLLSGSIEQWGTEAPLSASLTQSGDGSASYDFAIKQGVTGAFAEVSFSINGQAPVLIESTNTAWQSVEVVQSNGTLSITPGALLGDYSNP